MATVYSVQKTVWDQTQPSKKNKPNELAGRVRIAYAPYLSLIHTLLCRPPLQSDFGWDPRHTNTNHTSYH